MEVLAATRPDRRGGGGVSAGTSDRSGAAPRAHTDGAHRQLQRIEPTGFEYHLAARHELPFGEVRKDLRVLRCGLHVVRQLAISDHTHVQRCAKCDGQGDLESSVENRQALGVRDGLPCGRANGREMAQIRLSGHRCIEVVRVGFARAEREARVERRDAIISEEHPVQAGHHIAVEPGRCVRSPVEITLDEFHGGRVFDLHAEPAG